jgi:pimeloyl-ACP methyl ester carboxylesterase
MTEPITRTLEVPGAVLTYDVRTNDSTTEPPLLLIGSPMGASGFGTLATHFPDRTVVTYDPRGAERSRRTDGATETTPDEHADDLHRLIEALGARPVDLFATSGGAVNALALVARHPEDVRTLVAHEPPAIQEVPDREAALAATVDIHDTYLAEGYGRAMAKFIALVSLRDAVPSDFAKRPAPDPAMFGLPTVDDGSRDDPLVGQNMISCNAYRHDFEALRRAPTRIVIGVGAETDGTLASRAAIAVADRLGIEPVTFPSHHAGFLGGDHGQAGQPEAFAATLREVLAPAPVR